ncbi:DUF1993 domain-containing protein [Alishewanella sp. BS5-314]|uniref:DUF1993 domain-containing protein n=1 Tax=Alishewanella sp. BS5-314 TaxID=2755587 RepID=UPI0021BA9F4A|nr:DUF1993 domain-containing protein [Alishewanella sp. BS5-314]MCT8126540.1 DUF1993 domain-containing protein [Alishewanella sp. BS5-314]
MTISLNDISTPVFSRSLTNLARLLRKANYQAQLKGYPAALLLQSRLYPDMFELSKQIVRAAEIAAETITQLSGITEPDFAEPLITMEQHIARVNHTLSFLISVAPRQVNSGAEKDFLLPPTFEEQYSALGYILFYAVPNFHFHVTTAYNILRHNGVAIGKQDYLGRPQQDDPAWPDLGAFI